MSEGFNPDYDPTGIEGGVDTNALPWMAVPKVAGMHLKPLRASTESGVFSAVVKLEAGAAMSAAVALGGMDMLVLSGTIQYAEDGVTSVLEPGAWGYIPANTRITSMAARGNAEFLANFYSALAFLSAETAITSMLTSLDVLHLAQQHGVTVVPNTLAACAQKQPNSHSGKGEPLAIAAKNASEIVVSGKRRAGGESKLNHPHFIDTREVPWLEGAGLPDIALKILRVSEETGIVSMIVRHNGVAPPHNHLGAGDFMVLSGRIGYRAGPPDGYGAGVWFYEPAGARHESTQRLTDEDLIYTANIYGPVAFDSGRGTPITNVLSWMEYQALAKAGAA